MFGQELVMHLVAVRSYALSGAIINSVRIN